MPVKKYNIRGARDAAPVAGGGKYAGPMPPIDTYRGKVRFLKVTGPNRNGDDMLRGAVQIAETGKKAKYNGYLLNFNLNISDQGAPYVNAFLTALGGERLVNLFWTKGARVDESGKVLGIGTWNYEDNTIEVAVTTQNNTYKGNTSTVVAGFLLRVDQASDSDDESEDEVDVDDEDLEFDDEDAEDAEDAEIEDEEPLDEDEDEDEDEEDSDQDRAELEALDRPELVKRARAAGLKGTKGKSDEELIEYILEEPPF